MTTSPHQHESKDALLSQLASLVQQCETRFSNRYELATELEDVVSDLCASLEQVFLHGLKKQTTNKLNILNGFIAAPKSEIHFWNFVCLYLTEHEVQRFLSLRNVNTDYGRGRSWIRNALNEHSLEKYISIILEDHLNYRKQFYHEWALLFDEQSCASLISFTLPLKSVLFALNIDRADLDVSPSADLTQSNSQVELSKLIPVKKSTENTVLVRTRKKKSNFITINDEEVNDSDLESDIYARSAPVPSFMAASCSSSASISANDREASGSTTPTEPKLIATKSSSSLSIQERMVLYPLDPYDPSVDSPDTSDTVTVSDGPNSVQKLKDRIDSLEAEKEKILRDNNLLKIQLNKYCAAIELLKYNNKVTSPDKTTIAGEDNTSRNSDIEDYEKKLVQVSEMHGEVVEFNEHLYRVIQQKDSIISRLRDELIELRGPLPDNDEILSISSETETHSNSGQSLPRPLINILIPTAFLSGGFKGKSHHIYQIYIRIKEEEWNVYRRYSQFYQLHKHLKEKHSCISQFDFPPKKAIGNKDSKVVQERRKKLEFYLRNVINYIQTQYADLSSKEKLIAAVPFLSDKFFIQDRSHSQSDTNLSNTQQQQSGNSQHYMGF